MLDDGQEAMGNGCSAASGRLASTVVLSPAKCLRAAITGRAHAVNTSPRTNSVSGWLRMPRFWLGLAFSVVALALALRGIRWREVSQALAHASVSWLALALGTFLVTTWLKAVRWRLLFFPEHSSLPLRVSLEVLLIGQLANNVLPARSGDLVRAILIGKQHGMGGALALATVLVEKALDSVMLLVLVALLSFRVILPTWLRRSGLTVSVALAGLLLAMVVMASYQDRINAILESSVKRHRWMGVLHVLKRLAESSRELGALRSARVQAGLWVLSSAIWVLALSTNALVFRAVGLQVDVPAAAVLLVVLMVGAILPTSPLQLGVFHYLCVLTLSLFGVDQTLALTYAVLLHLIVFVPIALGGAVGLWAENMALGGLDSVRGAEVDG